MLTITEAAKFMRLSAPTLRRWDKAGILKSYRTAGNHRRYRKDDLCAFLGIFDDSKKESSTELRINYLYARASSYRPKISSIVII